MKLNSMNSNVSKYSEISKDSATSSINTYQMKENKSMDRNNTAGFNNSVILNRNTLESNQINKCSEIKNNTNSQIAEEESQKKINYSKEEVREKVSSIFLNFAKYYKEEKEFLLSQQSLIKIIKKLNLIDEVNLKLSDVDIIFRRVNPHSNKINAKKFLDFIVKLVHKLNPFEYKQNPKECINLFIANTFEPYSKYIEENQKESEVNSQSNNKFLKGNIEVLFTRQYDTRITGIINSIYYAIKEIYINYFHYENNRYKDIKKIEEGSLESLTDFCRDFEIIPFIATIHQLVVYFNILIKLDLNSRDNLFVLEEKRELGSLFTLSKFCLLFIHFSILSYSKSNVIGINKNITDVDKLILFLEKLENSNGFLNLERKTSKPHSSKLSLIPNKSVLKMVDIEILKSYNMFENKENYYSYNSEEEGKIDIKKDQALENKIIKEFNEKCNTGEEYDLRDLLAVNNEVYNALNSKINQLKELYQYYTKIGDKLHLNRMSLYSYIKFLKDSKIIVHVPEDCKKSFYAGNNSSFMPTHRFDKSKSPIRSDTNLKNSFSILSSKNGSEKKLSNKSYNKTLTHLVNSNHKTGKLTEIDGNIIFLSLTGPKNFDNTSKSKVQLSGNSPYVVEENWVNSTKSFITVEKENNNRYLKVNVQYKMDFYLFVKSFELIATKMYPYAKLNEGVLELIEMKLSPLIDKLEINKNTKSMMKMLDNINEPEIKNFLKELQHFISFFYENYSDGNFIMSYEQFKNFYKDFSLFPDIINLIQLKNIFTVFSEIHSNESIQNHQINIDNSELKSMSSHDLVLEAGKRMIQGKHESINFSLFMDSLAMTALHFKFDQKFRELDKLIYLVERINQSKGLLKFQIKTGKSLQSGKDLVTFLLSIKDKYPDFYNAKVNSKKNDNAPISFEDVYNSD